MLWTFGAQRSCFIAAKLPIQPALREASAWARVCGKQVSGDGRCVGAFVYPRAAVCVLAFVHVCARKGGVNEEGQAWHFSAPMRLGARPFEYFGRAVSEGERVPVWWIPHGIATCYVLVRVLGAVSGALGAFVPGLVAVPRLGGAGLAGGGCRCW